MQVGICGAGIAGLALANFLARHHDIEIEVYEARPEVLTISTEIAIWEPYWHMLETIIDLENELKAEGKAVPPWNQMKGPTIRMSDNRIQGEDFLTMRFGPRLVPRITLLSMLHKNLERSKVRIITNKKLLSWKISKPDSRVTAYFKDGTESTVDLLVGADGIHSKVRPLLFANTSFNSEPQFCGQTAYRMKYPREALRRAHPKSEVLQGFKIWCGNGGHVNTNPESVGSPDINMTVYDHRFDERGQPVPHTGPWVAEASPTEIIEGRYDRWEPDLVQLLQGPRTASRWAIHVVPPLPTYVRDRVCLIGDAAHAMTPHLGLGGNMAIHDAYVLAQLLGQGPAVTGSGFANLLSVYDSIRRPVSQEIARRSMSIGLRYAFLHPDRSSVDPLVGLGEDVVWNGQLLAKFNKTMSSSSLEETTPDRNNSKEN